MSKPSQSQKIYEHLLSGRSITQAEAIDLYGCYRLAARIADLRAAGHDIETTIVENRANSSHHAEYRLATKTGAAS